MTLVTVTNDDKGNTVLVSVDAQAQAKLAIRLHDTYCESFKKKGTCLCSANKWRNDAQQLMLFILSS